MSFSKKGLMILFMALKNAKLAKSKILRFLVIK